MIEIIPAIDIIGGRCVRLSKGDYALKSEYGDPLDAAKAFADAGASRLHLVDLDGAKASSPVNLKTLEGIAALGSLRLEWGGGIKTSEALASVFDAGADYAVVGSVAALKPELFREWLACYGPSRMVLGADVRDSKVMVSGWLEGTQLGISELIESFPGLTQAICTDISRDGMLCGPAEQMYVELQAAYPGVDFTVSGGISSMEDVRRLDALGLRKVIVGKAFYEGRITLKELSLWWQNA